MDQIGYTFLPALMAINSNFMQSIFRYFRPSPLGFLPEQTFENFATTTALADTNKMSYAGARPKQKASIKLGPQLRLKNEIMQKRCTSQNSCDPQTATKV